MTKLFDDGKSLREKILKGAELLFRNVKSTIGPARENSNFIFKR